MTGNRSNRSWRLETVAKQALGLVTVRPTASTPREHPYRHDAEQVAAEEWHVTTAGARGTAHDS
ncbi:hypothetical protein C9J85_17600 [Haloferax sp. wsp5]|nr:hypothetical protein C9J85_17600 [Haloferax sp. wsp5]